MMRRMIYSPAMLAGNCRREFIPYDVAASTRWVGYVLRAQPFQFAEAGGHLFGVGQFAGFELALERELELFQLIAECRRRAPGRGGR